MVVRGTGLGSLMTTASNAILNAQDRVTLAGEQLVTVSSPPTSRETAQGVTRKAGVVQPDAFDTPYSPKMAQAVTNLSFATMNYTAAAALVKVSDTVTNATLDLIA